MSPNASLLLTKKDQTATVDIDAIMDNVSIILYSLTVVLGIPGNSLVICLAGFKLKVDTFGLEYFSSTSPKKNLFPAWCCTNSFLAQLLLFLSFFFAPFSFFNFLLFFSSQRSSMSG